MSCLVRSYYLYDHALGEWQCHECHAWYFTALVDQRVTSWRVYDRETTPDQLTQVEQVAILDACRVLQAQGYRFLVDFGWENARALAHHACP